jgi:hypothetical protein
LASVTAAHPEHSSTPRAQQHTQGTAAHPGQGKQCMLTGNNRLNNSGSKRPYLLLLLLLLLLL